MNDVKTWADMDASPLLQLPPEQRKKLHDANDERFRAFWAECFLTAQTPGRGEDAFSVDVYAALGVTGCPRLFFLLLFLYRFLVSRTGWVDGRIGSASRLQVFLLLHRFLISRAGWIGSRISFAFCLEVFIIA